MVKFESVCQQLFNSNYATVKLLLGGLLCSIPVVNIFALGYLYLFAQQIRRTHVAELPDWDNWGTLFIQGIRFLCVFFVYFLLPLLAFWILGGLANLFLGSNLGAMTYFPLQISLIFLPGIFVSALLEHIEIGELSALSRVKPIITRALRSMGHLLVPSFALLGLLMIGFPVLLGFTFFLGYCLIIPYCLFVFFSNK